MSRCVAEWPGEARVISRCGDVQALVFAALHENVAQLPVFFVFGLMTAWLYRRSQGLAASLAFHAFNNAFAALAIVAVTTALNKTP